jgi:hypothetical protein
MVQRISEISEIQADMIKSIAALFLLLVSGFVAKGAFTCIELNFINTHKYIQIVIMFIFFFFLVTSISNAGNLAYIPPTEKLIYSFVYFLLFLVTMRLYFIIMIVVLMLIFIIYFIELNKEFYLNVENNMSTDSNKTHFTDNHKYWFTLDYPVKIRLFPVNPSQVSFISKIENIIYYIIIFLLIIGFIAYGGEIRDTIKTKKTLSWLDLIINTEICKIKNNYDFWKYFQMGLWII